MQGREGLKHLVFCFEDQRLEYPEMLVEKYSSGRGKASAGERRDHRWWRRNAQKVGKEGGIQSPGERQALLGGRAALECQGSEEEGMAEAGREG